MGCADQLGRVQDDRDQAKHRLGSWQPNGTPFPQHISPGLQHFPAQQATFGGQQMAFGTEITGPF
jgi:hypothetical protein